MSQRLDSGPETILFIIMHCSKRTVADRLVVEYPSGKNICYILCFMKSNNLESLLKQEKREQHYFMYIFFFFFARLSTDLK